MNLFRKIISLLLVLVMTMSFAFAGNEKGLITGDLTDESTEAKETIAMNYMNKKNMNGNFKVKSSMLNGDLTTVRLQQYHNNIPVWGADYIVNVNEKGVVKSYVSNVTVDLDKIGKELNEKINKPQAIEIAKADLGFEPDLLEVPHPELIIFEKDGVYSYTYLIELLFDEPQPGRWFYFVDVATGNVVNKFNQLSHGKPSNFNGGDSVEGKGTDVLGITRTIDTAYANGQYYMVDQTRGQGIYTYNAKSRTRLPGDYWTDDDNVYNAAYDKAAVSSQYFLAVTFDYFKDKFNRTSFDNNGAKVISSVHVGRNYNNAYWNGRQFAFGDGDGSYFIELSGALDVVAHEFTHAVTERTADLIYQNESGALNEAMSDIIGAAVEFYHNENPDWLLGEDIIGPGFTNPALRSMADPTVCGDPDHYSTRYTGSEDNGGVHINSGIINKVAYLFAEGGSHYGVTVQGHGVEAMEDVFYRALTVYMTSSTNFSAARVACTQAASDLYGANSPQVTSIQAAFEACGIN